MSTTASLPIVRWPRAVLQAAAIYLLVTLVHTWPLARIADAQVMHSWSPEDLLLVIWIMSWDLHALSTSPLHLFQGNVLYPTPDALVHWSTSSGTSPSLPPSSL